MIDPQRAFRDYVTRVSFSLSMSRNQIAVLRSIVLDMEAFDPKIPYDKQHPGTEYRQQEIVAARANGFQVADLFIPGLRYLLSTGIIIETAEWRREDERCERLQKDNPHRSVIRNYNIPHYQLTEAGEHVVGLLRIAGLIPQSAANANRSKRKRAS